MFSDIRRNLRHSTPTRYNRVMSYIYNLKEHITINNKTDLEIVDEIEMIAKQIIKKVKVYTRFNLAFYFAIYFSFISFFFGDIFIVSEIATLISRVISVFGTAIFILGIYFSQKIIDLYYQDLNLITAHLISIYSKHQKETIEELPTLTSNYYAAFIDFFKRRYGDE